MQSLSKTLDEKLNDLLQRAIVLDKANFGNIQLYNRKTETLHIVAQQGFNQDFLEHFKIVNAFDSSACGRASCIGSPVIITDVTLDLAFIPHRAIARSAGFRSVKSVPIISKPKNLLGVISTHFKNPKWDWEMNTLDEVIAELAELLPLKTL